MPTNLTAANLEILLEAETLSGGTGASVASWAGLPGNVIKLTAGANQPTLSANQINGKNAVNFSGSNNPLVWNGSLNVACGFLVVKINTFDGYNGVLSSPSTVAILEARNTERYFYDNRSGNGAPSVYDFFEYRLNDRIYPNSAMPAPVGEWAIVYFRFWRVAALEGIQLGQDRNFAARKLNGQIALMGLYSEAMCEEDIRKNTESIAASYNLPIAPVFPYQASKADAGQLGEVILSDGSREPNMEILQGSRLLYDASFNARSSQEFRSAREFRNRYRTKTFLFRNYNLIPPEDTIMGFPANSKFDDKGNTGIKTNYAVQFIQRLTPLLYTVPDRAPFLPPVLETTPSVPLGVAAAPFTANPANGIVVSWLAARPFSGRTIAFYTLKLNGAPIADKPAGLSVAIGTLQPVTLYTVQVAAVDSRGEQSEFSAPVSVTTSALLVAAAPTNAIVRDDSDSFGFTIPTGRTLADLEYTISGPNGGTAPVSTNPIGGLTGEYPIGTVGVRDAAAPGRAASAWLFNDLPFHASASGNRFTDYQVWATGSSKDLSSTNQASAAGGNEDLSYEYELSTLYDTLGTFIVQLQTNQPIGGYTGVYTPTRTLDRNLDDLSEAINVFRTMIDDKAAGASFSNYLFSNFTTLVKTLDGAAPDLMAAFDVIRTLAKDLGAP